MVDALVCATVVACGIAGWATARPKATPPIPATICASDAGAPDYAALYADGHLTIVAVFGEIEGDTARDPALISRAALEAALVARGFVADRDRFTRGATEVTLVGPLPRAEVPAIDTALAAALASPTVDVVYYNGHEYGGSLTALSTPPATGYRVAVLDTCWSTQRYSTALASPTVAVVGNSERAVTGSVASFARFIDGLPARAPWPTLLAPMNALAADRAAIRAPFDRYPDAEHYRHDVRCR